MPYPTPCAVKGCPNYVNLPEPLPSNMRFCCPGCEDAVFFSIIGRLQQAGYTDHTGVENWRRAIAHWRKSARGIVIADGLAARRN